LTSVKVLRQFPAHLFVQVVEALSTYPTVVLGDVAFPLDVRGIGLHEFCPASFAVIVVPILPWRDVLLRAEDCAPSPLCIVDAPVRHGESKPIMSIVVTRWDEKAGLRRDAVGSQVIDVLEAQEIKETGNEED
jgi:hypothetical protein